MNALDGVSLDEETGSFDGVVIDFEGLRAKTRKMASASFSEN